jgi:anti-anti-sigma factor
MTITILKLEGRLDTTQTAKIEMPFTVKAGSLIGPDALAVIDLSEVTYISSMGIRLLVTTLKQFRSRNIRFATVQPRDALARECLEIANLVPLLHLAESHDEACASLGQGTG